MIARPAITTMAVPPGRSSTFAVPFCAVSPPLPPPLPLLEDPASDSSFTPATMNPM